MVIFGLVLIVFGLGGTWFSYSDKLKSTNEELRIVKDECERLSKGSVVQPDRRLPELQTKLEGIEREVISLRDVKAILTKDLEVAKKQVDNEKAKSRDLLGRLETIANQPTKTDETSVLKIVDTLIRVRDRVNENLGTVTDTIGLQALHSIDRYALAELVKMGVEEFQTTNQFFDEASSKVAAIEDQGRAPRTVLQTIRCGYRLGGEVHRFEEVVIQK